MAGAATEENPAIIDKVQVRSESLFIKIFKNFTIFPAWNFPRESNGKNGDGKFGFNLISNSEQLKACL